MTDQRGRTIETDRLLLRPHLLIDFPPSAAMWMDARITEYIGGAPSTRQAAWARVHRYAGHWALLGYGYWAVFEKATGGFVGEVGFADFLRELEPSLDGKRELGWVIAAHAQRRGFGTEAVVAALAWGDAHFPGTTFAALIAPDNRASIRIAEKTGFHRETTTTYDGTPTLIYERRRR